MLWRYFFCVLIAKKKTTIKCHNMKEDVKPWTAAFLVNGHSCRPNVCWVCFFVFFSIFNGSIAHLICIWRESKQYPAECDVSKTESRVHWCPTKRRNTNLSSCRPKEDKQRCFFLILIKFCINVNSSLHLNKENQNTKLKLSQCQNHYCYFRLDVSVDFVYKTVI